MQREFYNGSTSAMFTAPSVSQTHAPLYNHDGQNNNVYSANYFTPSDKSTVSTSVSQNFSTDDRIVGFSSNMPQPSTPVSIEIFENFKYEFSGMLRDIVLKYSSSLEAKKIDSGTSNNSVIVKAEHNTIYSESIVPEETSMIMQEHVKRDDVATFDFNGVLVLPSEFQTKTIAKQVEEKTEDDQNSVTETENLFGGKNIESLELSAHRKEMCSVTQIIELPDFFTMFKEV